MEKRNANLEIEDKTIYPALFIGFGLLIYGR
jgi:hypothetical protein